MTQAAQTAAARPEEAAAREALRREIARALEENSTLRQELSLLLQDEVVQSVLAEGSSQIRHVEQVAGTGPTTREVKAGGGGVIESVRQICKEK